MKRCPNVKCKCPDCICGKDCTCGVSPDVVCDPCRDFKSARTAAQSEAQAQSLTDKTSATKNPCGNPKCRCPDCACGQGCTCGVSMDVVCDPCKDFKKTIQALQQSTTSDTAVATPSNPSNPCGNPKCKCPDCACGHGCTCGVSMDVVCDPCKEFKTRKAEILDASAKTRYSRHIVLDAVGLDGQSSIMKSRILVVGAGGLGYAWTRRVPQSLSCCKVCTSSLHVCLFLGPRW